MLSYIYKSCDILDRFLTRSSNITNDMTQTRILVVDDEPDVNLTLKVSLEDKGFKVDAFDDPLLALDNFKAGVYGLLILDIKMPEMNGFELYREIKKIDDKVKVCFLTALTELHDYEAFRKEVFPKVGERYFIQKPIENEEMIKRVNEMMTC
jgi:two-component system, OmpR family, response regulator ChvI